MDENEREQGEIEITDNALNEEAEKVEEVEEVEKVEKANIAYTLGIISLKTSIIAVAIGFVLAFFISIEMCGFVRPYTSAFLVLNNGESGHYYSTTPFRNRDISDFATCVIASLLEVPAIVVGAIGLKKASSLAKANIGVSSGATKTGKVLSLVGIIIASAVIVLYFIAIPNMRAYLTETAFVQY